MLMVTEPGIIFSALLSNDAVVKDDNIDQTRRIYAAGVFMKDGVAVLVELPKTPHDKLKTFTHAFRQLYLYDGAVHVNREELGLINELGSCIQEAVESHNRVSKGRIESLIVFP